MSARGDERARHDRWREDLAAYALGSLPPADAEAFERHLGECEDCRERLHWLSPAVAALAESVPRLEPPPGLKERIMAAAGAGTDPVPATPRRARRRGLALRPAAGLAALALLGAAVGGYVLRGGDGTITERQAAGRIVATLEHEEGSGTLVLTGLRQLDAGHIYQAWIARDGEVIPSSLFAPHADGSASAAIPAGLEGADRVMVTVEPRRGSETPRGTPVVSVPIG